MDTTKHKNIQHNACATIISNIGDLYTHPAYILYISWRHHQCRLISLVHICLSDNIIDGVTDCCLKAGFWLVHFSSDVITMMTSRSLRWLAPPFVYVDDVIWWRYTPRSWLMCLRTMVIAHNRSYWLDKKIVPFWEHRGVTMQLTCKKTADVIVKYPDYMCCTLHNNLSRGFVI